MKILITGGAGYIGSVITNLALQQGYVVKVVDTLWFNKSTPSIHRSNPAYEFLRADFGNSSVMERLLDEVDYIVHAAAVVGEPASKKNPELTRRINYDASIKLIEMAQLYNVKGLVFLSTCSNYGISEGLASEETSLKPLSLYAETKVSVERYLMDKVKGLDWVICRLATVYGSSPRMRFDLTVNDFTMNAYIRKYLDIFLPFSHRPYIHVLDVAKVIMKMLKDFQRVKNNVFNVGFNSENYQKIQIAEIVKKFVPETKIEIVKTGTDLRDYQVDFSKLQSFLYIKNTFTVEEGVKEVLRLLKDRIITDPYKNCYYNTTPELEGD